MCLLCALLQHGDLKVNQAANDENLFTFYHEGFFWRCKFGGREDEDNMLKFWFSKAQILQRY